MRSKELGKAFLFILLHTSKKDCWVWKGHKNPQGYGIVTYDGKIMNAHRYVYILYYGKIPFDLEIHHTCENKLCVNPKHLVAMTKCEHEGVHHPGVIINSPSVVVIKKYKISGRESAARRKMEKERRKKMWEEFKKRKKFSRS